MKAIELDPEALTQETHTKVPDRGRSPVSGEPRRPAVPLRSPLIRKLYKLAERKTDYWSSSGGDVSWAEFWRRSRVGKELAGENRHE